MQRNWNLMNIWLYLVGQRERNQRIGLPSRKNGARRPRLAGSFARSHSIQRRDDIQQDDLPILWQGLHDVSISQLVLTTDCCNHTQIQKLYNLQDIQLSRNQDTPGGGGGGGGGYSTQIKILVDTCRGKVKNGGLRSGSSVKMRGSGASSNVKIRGSGVSSSVKMRVSGTDFLVKIVFVGRVWLALWLAANPGALAPNPVCRP